MVVIGRLGHPLETMLAIRGTWQRGRSPKDSGASFHVTHVNGKAIAEPVVFHQTLVQARDKDDDRETYPTPPIGQSWEIRARPEDSLVTQGNTKRSYLDCPTSRPFPYGGVIFKRSCIASCRPTLLMVRSEPIPDFQISCDRHGSPLR